MGQAMRKRFFGRGKSDAFDMKKGPGWPEGGRWWKIWQFLKRILWKVMMIQIDEMIDEMIDLVRLVPDVN